MFQSQISALNIKRRKSSVDLKTARSLIIVSGKGIAVYGRVASVFVWEIFETFTMESLPHLSMTTSSSTLAAQKQVLFSVVRKVRLTQLPFVSTPFLIMLMVRGRSLVSLSSTMFFSIPKSVMHPLPSWPLRFLRLLPLRSKRNQDYDRLLSLPFLWKFPFLFPERCAVHGGSLGLFQDAFPCFRDVSGDYLILLDYSLFFLFFFFFFFSCVSHWISTWLVHRVKPLNKHSNNIYHDHGVPLWGDCGVCIGGVGCGVWCGSGSGVGDNPIFIMTIYIQAPWMTWSQQQMWQT